MSNYSEQDPQEYYKQYVSRYQQDKEGNRSVKNALHKVLYITQKGVLKSFYNN